MENEFAALSKDTAYIDDEGKIVRQTITRPLSSQYDFVNTYIVNIFPDTTCWVNDFENAYNEPYVRMYFASGLPDPHRGGAGQGQLPCGTHPPRRRRPAGVREDREYEHSRERGRAGRLRR